MTHVPQAYLFRHVLLREAAYQLQLPAGRAQLHGLAFSALQAALGGPPPAPADDDLPASDRWSPHPLDSSAAELARHAALALQADSPPNPALAVARQLYLHRAAGHAEQQLALRSAVSLWRELAAETDGKLSAMCLRRAALSAEATGDITSAHELFNAALVAYRALGLRLNEGVALGNLAGLFASRGDIEQAENHYRQALDIHRELDNRRSVAIMLGNLANLCKDTGRATQAEELYQQALAHHRQDDDRNGEAIVLGNLAELWQSLGRTADAEHTFEQALAMHNASGKRRYQAMVGSTLAVLYYQTGRPPLAFDQIAQAIAVSRETEDRPGLTVTLANLATMRAQTGDLAQAERDALEALELAQELGRRRLVAGTLMTLADIYVRTDRATQAEPMFRRAIAIMRALKDSHSEAQSKAALAALLREQGQLDAADALFTEALGALQALKFPRDEGAVHCDHALVALARGDMAVARRRWQRGQAMLAEAGDQVEARLKREAMRLACTAAAAPPLDAWPRTQQGFVRPHVGLAHLSALESRPTQNRLGAAMKPDQEIARAAKLEPIENIAKRYGINRDELELYGDVKAKVKLSIVDRLASRPNGKYIDITAISPTPLGEGKTTNTIGVTMGLTHIGKKAACVIRQASLGPVFGIKGGAAGGGQAQVIPPEDLNIHLTGDIHAVQAANNLACAFLDNQLFNDNALNIDPDTINIRRGMDINDRDLRNIITGLRGNGIARETGFDIAVASEVMAILALAENLKDLRGRLGRMVVGFNRDGKAVTAEDIKVAGAMTAILRDAIKPNILQTIGGSLAFVHCGPFANIAHGNSSVVADRVALKVADYVVTESGFGADMGAEKFMNIKCRQSGLIPDAVGLVATVRALKSNSGKFKVVAGKPLPDGLVKEDLDALRAGMPNLVRHIKNMKAFGLPVVVGINSFGTESPAEIEMVQKAAREAGASDCVLSEVFSKGGEGGAEFAKALVKACEEPRNFKLTYENETPIKKKVEAVATKIYGAAGVDWAPEASKRVKQFEEAGFGKLAICMAKTQYSFSHDPKLLGAPEGWTLPIKDARLSAGAGFVYLICGDMMTMPGLGKNPGGQNIDINEKGEIVGMF